MVKFARAEGSKGSKKRVLEDATPWSEMVTQLNSTPGKMETLSEGGQGNDEKRKKRKVEKGEVNTKMNKKMHAEVKGTGKKLIKKEGNGNVTWYQPNVVKVKQVKKCKDQKKNEKIHDENKGSGKDLIQKKGKGNRTCFHSKLVKGERVKEYKRKKNRGKKKFTGYTYQFEENERMTCYEGKWMKPERAFELKKVKNYLMQKQNLDEKKFERKMTALKRRFSRELNMMLKYEKWVKETEEAAGKEDEIEQQQQEEDGKEDEKEQQEEAVKEDEKVMQFEAFVYPYEKDKRMSCYEGYWVKRKNVLDMIQRKEYLKSKNFDEKTYERKWRKVKEHFNRELITLLQYEKKLKEQQEAAGKEDQENQNQSNLRTDIKQKELDSGKRTPKKNTALGIKNSDSLLNRETMKRLEEELLQRGVSEEEVKGIIQKERKKEKQALKLQKKCGSTEHKASDCNGKNMGKFVHATCYACGESGHIARQCPSNPRGRYPNGGACKKCGSVEHFAKNCPSKMKEKRSQQ